MRKWLKRGAGIAAVVVAAAVGLFAWFVWWPVHTIPALEKVDEYVWLDQGWGVSQDSPLRERYYSAVMAATGLLYLAILTAFGTDLVARAVLRP